ncbi:MAG: tetratricopeptide repeat protein [Holosporales bacterium]
MTPQPSPERPELREAYFFHQTGRLSEAEALYRSIIEHDPSNPGAVHGLGVILAEHGHKNLALQYFEEAISLNPKESVFYRSYARLLDESGDTARALSALQTSLYIRPLDTETLTLLADLCRKIDDRYAAMGVYRQILVLNPANGSIHAALAECLFSGGLLDDALPHYAAAVRLLPFNAALKIAYVDALLAARQPREASEVLTSGEMLFAATAGVHQRRGRVALALDDVETGVAALERAYCLAPEDISILRDYAGALHEAGDYLSETKALQRLYTLDSRLNKAKK